VVEEIDWSVGRIVAKLEELDLTARTLVVFTSDNGPWLIRGLDGGSAGPLRDGKGCTWEGGMRVPGIFWWPGLIQPGVVHGIGSTLDLYTTCLSLAGAPPPGDRIVDGLDLSNTLLHGWPSPRDHMIFYRGVEIHAVRRGPFKAHFLTRPAYGPGSQTPERHDPPLLYNLDQDPGESHDVAGRHPGEIEAIRKLVADHEAKLVRGECQLTK
jgi:arylsulfatase A-like enzyme